MGRADNGVICTAGSFALEAKKESRRDGVPSINEGRPPEEVITHRLHRARLSRCGYLMLGRTREQADEVGDEPSF